jgi:hypothetical protein
MLFSHPINTVFGDLAPPLLNIGMKSREFGEPCSSSLYTG